MLSALLEAVVPTSAASVLFNFYAKKQVAIYDPVLGVADKLLQVLVVAYVVHLIWSTRSWEYVEVAEGFPTFAFERSTFNGDRNRSFDEFRYCANSSYDYYRPDEKNHKQHLAYWNDIEVSCKQSMYADIISADQSSARISTFEKYTLATTTNCLDQDTCVRHADKSQILNGGQPYILKEHNKGSYSCTCLEMRNYFPIGPENLGLSVHHTFTESTRSSSLRGSSTSSPDDVPSSSSKTHLAPIETTLIRKQGFDDRTYTRDPRTFKSGQAIHVSFTELLDIAFATNSTKDGSPLDERVSGSSVALADGEFANPFRRVTGVTLNVDLVSDIFAATDSYPTCAARAWSAPLLLRILHVIRGD
jgi:hypothetical protein